jgi:hypothetical protein
MSYQKYCEVIDQVCSELGISDSKSMYEVCNFRFEDNEFSLAHTMEDEGVINIFCDYGYVPSDSAARILRRVLETNMLAYNSKAPRLAANPDTGRVIMIANVSLEGLAIDPFLDLLSVYGVNAKIWRDTYFLEELMEARAVQYAEESVGNGALSREVTF